MNKAKYIKACRAAIPEGIVLLENDGTLPLTEGENIALFGRGQYEYIKSGTGSGGRVNCPYVTNISDALAARVSLDSEVSAFFRAFIAENPYDGGDDWCVPTSQKQPLLSDEFVAAAAKRNDKAIFVLARSNGEGFDVKAERGAYYLSEEEEQSIACIAKHFSKFAVLINGGNLIDMRWIKKYNVGTVALVWQGGQEGGTGTADALMGDVPPSGRLTDTIAAELSDYPSDGHFGAKEKNVHAEDIYVGYRYFETFAPEKVLYPFGYGQSYTSFRQTVNGVTMRGNTLEISVTVQNTGAYKGKDVVQVYFSAPQGVLGKPARELIAYKKTKILAPAKSQTLRLTVSVNDMCAYDDGGKTEYPYAYVLEKGQYKIYVGQNVRAAQEAYAFTVENTRLVRQCTQALAPVEPFERMTTADGKTLSYEQSPTANYDMHARETADIPPVPAYTDERGITLKDVKKGKHSVSEFVAQFSDKTLAALVRGEGMASSKAPMPGTTGCFGGVTAALRKAGLPIISLCDGPSGVRLECPVPATCIPSGTLLASAWAPELFDALFGGFADEMLMYKVDVILAPGINIHRHPLGGRNFEYFSEDPFLSGTNAAAVAKYFTEKGVYCTVKHFAVNSQENDRSAENEVLSERALREIYLRPFEMAVRSGYTYALMTSYNRINGVSASANYDLTTTILRGEWRYKGFVMTDWWAQMDDHGTFGTQNLAAMVRAQNDVFMLTSDALTYEDNIEESLSNGRLQSAQLRRCAENLIAFILKTPAVRRKDKVVDVNDPALQCLCESTVQEKHASVTVAREGMYVAEIALRLPGSVLNQYAFRVRVDDRQGITLSHNGSEGELTSLRFKVILHCASTLWFDDADVESVRILGNENGGPIA